MNKFDGKMHEFCVGQGWCGGVVVGQPSHVTQCVPEDGMVSAGEFVHWLIRAEGRDPDESSTEMRRVKRQLQSIFIRHMGGETVPAEMLHSDKP